MRTGKHQFNYRAYAVEWAVKILANVKGYTLEKAYSIDRVFGVMVEERINLYKQEIELAKKFSVMCGVYGEMYNEYQDFGKYLSEEVEFFNNNNYKWFAEIAKQMVEAGEWNEEDGDKEALAFNEMITNRISNLFVKSGNLSLSRINQMPKSLANNFTTMKNLALDSSNKIRTYNMETLKNAETKLMFQAEYGSSSGYWKTKDTYDAKTNQFINEVNKNTLDYHNTLNNTYEQIRRLLDED